MELVNEEQFKGRDFLTLYDYTPEEINFIMDFAEKLKDEHKKGITHHLLKGKTLGMIFQKSSTRTRVSFEVGMYQLGGYALFLSRNDLQLGRGETIEDTGKVFSRYLDGIMIRTFDQAEVERLAEAADIPVINGLTDLLHPCQALADIFTIREYKGKLRGIKLAYVGDGNNVANSLLIAGAKMGMNVVVCCPPGYEPDGEVLKKAYSTAESTGSKIEVLNDPETAVSGADVVYTDVWTSMGQEDEAQKRAEIFKPYQVNADLIRKAKKQCIVMHCLPAHRGEEITDEVMDGKQSVVFDQAENRLHVQKAVMALIMAD
ncbi:MAG TPA: ornithine carbamoyltransferase [Peptococcaceae bacterium]|nr:MAG: Ornithine carbamoyltransferase, catabolic [Clostridia bacterium 41_269]HBT20912.1 ornithine carbamoyltransferase [Peptococcaceae bacterium]